MKRAAVRFLQQGTLVQFPCRRSRGRAKLQGLAFAVLGGLLGSCGDCPTTYHGVTNGQRLQTTIIERHSQGAMAQQGCLDLPDLPDGTVLASSTKLAGGEDTCWLGVDLQPTSVSSGIYQEGKIRLPTGCQGEVYYSEVRDDAASRSGPPNPEAPDWLLTRFFVPSSDPALCWPGRSDTPPACADTFIAENLRL